MIICYSNTDSVDFNELKDKVLSKIERTKNSDDNDALVFYCTDGSKYAMHYDQDCCASCFIDEINGDLEDLIGSPILQAEEKTNSDLPKQSEYDDSYTWTFYDLATIKSSVQIKWYGSSNGYYSESASFVKFRNDEDCD